MSALKTLCGFANTDGGSVFIPINDKGEVLKKPLSDEDMQNIANGVINSLGLQPNIISHHWQDKDFIEIKMLQAQSPIHFKNGYYIRVGNTTQRMSPYQLRSRMLDAVPWDTQIVKKASLNDLNKAEIKRFVTSGQDAGHISGEIDPNEPEVILKKTHLI